MKLIPDLSVSGTIKAYNKNASNYEQRWAAYLQHTHNAFINRLHISGNARILDLSCGTGLLARHIIHKKLPFDQLALNDPAEKMLEVAKSRIGDHPDVIFSHALAYRLPFEDHSFTHVLSLNSFHNYEQQQAAVKEVRRVLKPGGCFYLQDWNRSSFFRPVNALIRWRVPEHIDTRSMEEVCLMLKEQDFMTEREESWNYRYWKFFFIRAGFRQEHVPQSPAPR